MASNITKKYMLRNQTKDWYVGLKKPVKGISLVKGPDEILLETPEEVETALEAQAEFPQHIVVEEVVEITENPSEVAVVEEAIKEIYDAIEKGLSPEELELLRETEEVKKLVEENKDLFESIEEVNTVDVETVISDTGAVSENVGDFQDVYIENTNPADTQTGKRKRGRPRRNKK